MRRQSSNAQRGGVPIIVALLLLILLAFGALVVDLGWLRFSGIQLQSAVDASALAGAASLDRGGDAVRSQATGVAGLHSVAGQPLTVPAASVEIGRWDFDTATFVPAADDVGDAVRVTHRVSDVTAFLGLLLGHDRLGVTRAGVAGRRKTHAKCGILAESVAMVNGNGLIDSWDSTQGSYADTRDENGTVCSNIDASCSGSAEVRGDFLAGPEGDLNSSCEVTGEIGRLPAPVQLPEVDCSDARASNDNDLVQRYMRGLQFRANAQDDFVLPGGTYYFEGMRVNAGAQVRINDEVVICNENGDVTLNGDALINASQDPRLFTVMVGDDSKLTLNGNAETYGAYIAPYSEEVKLNGTMDFYGILIGYEVKANGDLLFHADESLMNDWETHVSSVKLLL
jgi:hypothetical protein